MRCRPGDLVVVIRQPRFEFTNGTILPFLHPGIVRRVVSLAPAGIWHGGRFYATSPAVLVWRFDEPVPFTAEVGGGSITGYLNGLGDEYLRPLRDSDETDEMLTIVRPPEKLPAMH
jgi:hypothetical protein